MITRVVFREELPAFFSPDVVFPSGTIGKRVGHMLPPEQEHVWVIVDAEEGDERASGYSVHAPVDKIDIEILVDRDPTDGGPVREWVLKKDYWEGQSTSDTKQ